MVHIELTTAAPEIHHKNFNKWLKSRKYPIEGKQRKGFCSPNISVVKHYDIRIKKEALPLFLQDLRNNTSIQAPCIDSHFGSFAVRFEKFVLWFLDLFTNFKKVNVPQTTTKKNDLKTWIYIKPLCQIEDPKDEDGEDLL